MPRYELTVITPAPAGCSVMHVFEIETAGSLGYSENRVEKE